MKWGLQSDLQLDWTLLDRFVSLYTPARGGRRSGNWGGSFEFRLVFQLRNPIECLGFSGGGVWYARAIKFGIGDESRQGCRSLVWNNNPGVPKTFHRSPCEHRPMADASRRILLRALGLTSLFSFHHIVCLSLLSSNLCAAPFSLCPYLLRLISRSHKTYMNFCNWVNFYHSLTSV